MVESVKKDEFCDCAGTVNILLALLFLALIYKLLFNELAGTLTA